jgi:2-polyprenyl-3-methyl-5-hydroxy-6-metoxy-1,4-benzoquinol methylase
MESVNYGWKDSEPTCAYPYVFPTVMEQIHALYGGKKVEILEIGCGNGYVASQLAKEGHSVTATDSSQDGIEIARAAYPTVRFEVCSVYEDHLEKLLERPVDCIIALEVIEHLFQPKKIFEQSHRVLKTGGYMITSTPYHGYLKNLALSLVNGWDRHFGPEWEGGHIKFFSKKTLGRMARQAGFGSLRFYGVGRFPWLWKSMIMVVQK